MFADDVLRCRLPEVAGRALIELPLGAIEWLDRLVSTATRSRAVIVIAWLTACGGGETGSRASELVGTWVLAAGATDTRDCETGGTPQHDVMDLAGYRFSIAAGTEADLEMSSITNGASPPTIAGWPDFLCPPGGAARIHFDVLDSTASTPSDESCTYDVVRSGGTNYRVVTAYYPFTIDLDMAGTTVTLDGHEHDQYSGTTSGTCTRVLAGVATRL